MASFFAELRVAGQVFRVQHCAFEVRQATHQRGRVSGKVRYGPVQLALDVPDGDLLLAWAADHHKRLAVQVLFRDADGGSVLETLSLKAAYCVEYREDFLAGEVGDGAYQCFLTLSDPDGWTLQAGGPAAAFVAPAPHEHGRPAAVVSAAATGAQVAAVANPDIPPHLPAPQPQPSPDHQQVQLTIAEWQTLTRGRWDRNNNKKFLKKYKQTEFHIEGDPFTYRTDSTGRVAAVYDAQRSYNITGSRKGLVGIPLTLNGEPTYAGTLHLFSVTGLQKNVAVIEMAGSRSGDFKRANEAAGLAELVKSQGLDADEAPDGYTWHHRDDFKPLGPPNPPYGACTMELVKVQAHRDTFVHYGSCDQCNKHYKKKLYK